MSADVFPPRDVTAARARLVGVLQAGLLRLAYATWRVQCDASRLDAPLAQGHRVMLVFWHGKYVPIFAALSGRRGCVFTSLSYRGAIIAEICRQFGYEPVLIPDRGAEASYGAMWQALTTHNLCGIAADGPLGPFHVVKRGLVRLASELGYEIVAASVASHPKRVFAERWDKMEIPRPFARVCIAMSGPIIIPSDLDEIQVDAWSVHVGSELDRADVEADEMRSGDPRSQSTPRITA